MDSITPSRIQGCKYISNRYSITKVSITQRKLCGIFFRCVSMTDHFEGRERCRDVEM